MSEEERMAFSAMPSGEWEGDRIAVRWIENSLYFRGRQSPPPEEPDGRDGGSRTPSQMQATKEVNAEKKQSLAPWKPRRRSTKVESYCRYLR
jgi:hypothetical protein